MSEELSALQAQVTALNEKADNLQAAIDADQEADAAIVVALKDQIATLEAQIANGATPEQLTALKDTLAGIASKLDASAADVAVNP